MYFPLDDKHAAGKVGIRGRTGGMVSRLVPNYCEVCIPKVRQLHINMLHYVYRHACRKEGHIGQRNRAIVWRSRVQKGSESNRLMHWPCPTSVPNKMSNEHRTVIRSREVLPCLYHCSGIPHLCQELLWWTHCRTEVSSEDKENNERFRKNYLPKKHSLFSLAKESLRSNLLPVQEQLHVEVITNNREFFSRQRLNKIKQLESEASWVHSEKRLLFKIQ